MSQPPSRVRTLVHGVATDESVVPLALFISHPVNSKMTLTTGGMMPSQTKKEMYVNVDMLPAELADRVRKYIGT